MKKLPLTSTNENEQLAEMVLIYGPDKQMDEDQINYTINQLEIMFDYAPISIYQRELISNLVIQHQLATYN